MTDREWWWMTATVWMEARGEIYAGQIAVAHVILNRLRDGRFGTTIGCVVLQPKQFSCWNTESPTRNTLGVVHEDEPAWLSCEKACRSAGIFEAIDPTRGACHYYNPAVAHPNWDAGQLLPRVQIGRHVFVQNVP